MKIFSGIQPSGLLHLGNYLGAIKYWIELQNKYSCIFSIVDLHAITVPYNTEKMQERILNTAITYLAAGVDPKKSIIFVQSHLPEHSELAWLLNTVTSLGELKRMTQFKEKAAKQKNVNAGLFNYPILMAADILLYQTNLVPVGEDQVQHVELTRTIAKRFNNRFGKVFVLPKALTPEKGARIMSLTNPQEKMSKTGDIKGCISLFDPPEVIKNKIKTAVTDSGKSIKYDPENKPAISNLITIYSILGKISIKNIETKYRHKGYAEFKNDLSKIVIESLTPLQNRQKVLVKNRQRIQQILNQGAKKAQKQAKKTLQKVKKAMGLI